MGNILLWRALTVTTDQQLQVDAIRVGFGVRTYPGERRELFKLDDLKLLDSDSISYLDVICYQKINQPLLIVHSETPLMIGDARYAMLPTRADPLWGLQINPEQPNVPSEFVTRRKLTLAMRKEFIDMLLGREVNSLE
jgi:inner membrane protein